MIPDCGMGDKKVRIISFVSRSSNSGKTTFIEKLLPVLKAHGLRVAVIKHASKGFELDHPGKDSWRFQQAGAESVVLVGPGKIALMKSIDAEPSLAELDGMAGDVDLVIFEGFKQNAQNKIEVFRAGVSGSRPLCMDDPACLALISDQPFDVSIPRFDIDDAEGVAEYILAALQKC